MRQAALCVTTDFLSTEWLTAAHSGEFIISRKYFHKYYSFSILVFSIVSFLFLLNCVNCICVSDCVSISANNRSVKYVQS